MKVLALLMLLLVSACSAPTPFRTGDAVVPPHGCIDLRARGGRC